MLTRSADSALRPLRVLTTYRAMIPSVRWFGTEQLRWLANEGMLELRAVPERKLSARDCRWADCVVLTRADTPFELWLARTLRRMGRKLAYVLDDDLEHVPEGLGSSAYYRDPAVVRLGKAVRACCDVLVTHSPLIEQDYGAGFARTARIEQPAMSAQSTPPSCVQDARSTVRIGFSGSEDRAADVQAVLAAPLRELKARYGNRVEIEFFGARPPLVDELGLSHIPYTPSAELYYQTMAGRQWDIGLAPLENTRFYQCKYYNKFVEYCTYGIAGLYADQQPYRGVVRDGVDGVLCAQGEWLPTLCRLVEDVPLRVRLAQNARQRARDFSLDKVSLRFWQALGSEFTDWRAQESKLSQALLVAQRAGCGLLFVSQTLKRHGLRVFTLAWERIRKSRRRGRA